MTTFPRGAPEYTRTDKAPLTRGNHTSRQGATSARQSHKQARHCQRAEITRTDKSLPTRGNLTNGQITANAQQSHERTNHRNRAAITRTDKSPQPCGKPHLITRRTCNFPKTEKGPAGSFFHAFSSSYPHICMPLKVRHALPPFRPHRCSADYFFSPLKSASLQTAFLGCLDGANCPAILYGRRVLCNKRNELPRQSVWTQGSSQQTK